MKKQLLRVFALFVCSALALPASMMAKKAGCITCKAARARKQLQTRAPSTKPEQKKLKLTHEPYKTESINTESINIDNPDDLLSLETRAPVRTVTIRHNLNVLGDTTIEGTTTINDDLSVGDCKTFSIDKISAKSQNYVTVLNDLALRPCKKILVNEIDPVIKVSDEDACNEYAFESYEDGTLRLSGNTAVNPTKKLLVNEINPVTTETVYCTDADEYITAYVEDESGTTTLSGNIAVNGTASFAQAVTNAGTVSITSGQKLLVNEINPIDEYGDEYDAGTTTLSGNVSVAGTASFDQAVTNAGTVSIASGQKLLVNEINPIDEYGNEYDAGTTTLSGNVAVSGTASFAQAVTHAGTVSIVSGQKLLVNEINPIDEYGNEYDAGTTTLSGNVQITPGKILYINEINPVLDSGLTTTFSGKTHFTQQASIAYGKKLLVNEINPIDSNGDEYDAGTTNFSGNASIAYDKKLLVNEINPIDEYGNEYDAGTTNFSGDLKVQSSRILGQTEAITFGDAQETGVLKIYFTNASNTSTDSTISTGAHIRMHLFGTATGNESSSFFDVFTDLESFVGPGTFNNTTLTAPVARIGNDEYAFGDVSVAPTYTAGADVNGSYVQVSLTVTGNPDPYQTYDNFAGSVYYEIVSNNVDHIAPVAIPEM